MVAMTKTIARGYAREGILAFAVCPGFTMTGMAEDYLASRGGDKLLADIPLGRVADARRGRRRWSRWLALDAPAVDDRRGARRERGELCPLSRAGRSTLPCTRAEAEAIDAADDLAIDAVLMTTEEVEDDVERWRLDAYIEREPDAAMIAAIARAGAERGRRRAGDRARWPTQDWVTMSQAGLEPIARGALRRPHQRAPGRRAAGRPRVPDRRGPGVRDRASRDDQRAAWRCSTRWRTRDFAQRHRHRHRHRAARLRRARICGPTRAVDRDRHRPGRDRGDARECGGERRRRGST